MGFDYRDYVPRIGDERYKKFRFKPVLDYIRVYYYSKYGVDPSIADTSINHPLGEAMFYDPTLPIYGSCYCFRGKFPFKIYLQDLYEKGFPDDMHTIGIEIAAKKYTDEGLIFSLDLIRYLSGKEANLIVKSYGPNPKYSIAFISRMDFVYGLLDNSDSYYEFFHRLCDNNVRNIIYIGDDLKFGVSREKLDEVEEEFVEADQARLADCFGVSIDELREKNSAIREKVLIRNLQ